MVRRGILILFGGALLVTGAGCGNPAFKGCTTVLEPGANDQKTVQAALIDAKPGDTVCFDKGTFKFTDEVSLAVDNVTVKGYTADGATAPKSPPQYGAGEPTTLLDFSGQVRGGNGLAITGNGITVEDLAVYDTAGDALRADKVKDITFKYVKAGWRRGRNADNGGYALYPVLSTNVIVDHCTAFGASDTGVYVGQSNHIFITHNEAYENVAGIEVENSVDADVHDNYSHDNAGGVLVFALPNLDVKTSGRARVFHNRIESNNGENFAPQGNIVGLVPSGTGMLVFGSKNNEIFDNTIKGNQSMGIGLVNFEISGRKYDDPSYDPYPEGNYTHDNTFTANGDQPADVAVALVGTTPLTDIIWDGVTDPSKDNSDGHLTNCFHNNGGATYLDFAYGQPTSARTTDITEVTCTHPSLPPVSF